MNQLGLSREAMERELRWIFRHGAKDTDELIKLVSGAIVSLIEKNNAMIAERIAGDDETAPEEDY